MGWKEINYLKVKKLLTNDLPEEIIDKIIDKNHLLINSDKKAVISLVSKKVLNIFNKIKSKGVQPLFIGLKLLDTTDFIKARLSIPLARKASEHEVTKVIINPKAEQLFLYARDIWSDSIISVVGTVRIDRVIFVYNQTGCFLGMAFPTTNDLINQGSRVVLKRLIDTGYYLRCEKKIS